MDDKKTEGVRKKEGKQAEMREMDEADGCVEYKIN